MTTEEFYSASVVVAFLAPATLLAQMYIFAPGIHLVNKTHFMVWLNLGGVLFSIFMNLLLIPLMGIAGAALSTMLANLLVFAGHLYFSQRYYPVPHEWWRIFYSILGCIAVVVTLSQFELVGWWKFSSNVLVLMLLMLLFVWLRLIRVCEVTQLIEFLRHRLAAGQR